MTMPDYFAMVDARPSPASRGERRTDRVVSIDFAGPVTALARVECSIGPKHFTDLLTLVHVDGRWQIIAKVFHFDLEATRADMPYVNIKITNEGASSSQKAALISGVTELLVGVLGKDPATTFVVIDEVETEHWGIGGLPVEEYRSSNVDDMTRPTRRRARSWVGPHRVGARRVIRFGARLRTMGVERTCLMEERHRASWAERVLVERLSGGDETALVDLYDRYAGFVYGLAVRTLVDRQAAEDLTQDVFVSLVGASGAHRVGARDPARLPRDAHPPPCGRRGPPGGGAPAPGDAGGTGGG